MFNATLFITDNSSEDEEQFCDKESKNMLQTNNAKWQHQII